MIFSASTSRWQTVIADLSLILFLVAASALEDAPETQQAEQTKAQQAENELPPAPDIALTLWSDVSGSPPLANWLAEQAPDDQQRLSITVTYRAGSLDAAIARAAQLRQESGIAGADAHIVIAQGQRDLVLVRLVQDSATP